MEDPESVAKKALGLDYVAWYLSNPPPPTEYRSYLTFSQSVHFVVPISGSSLSMLIVRAFGLLSGNFTTTAQGVDSKGSRVPRPHSWVLP